MVTFLAEALRKHKQPPKQNQNQKNQNKPNHPKNPGTNYLPPKPSSSLS